MPSARRIVPLVVALASAAATLVVACAGGEGDSDAVRGGATDTQSRPRPAAVYHVAPGGKDGGPCTRRRPCRSFDRAYRAAAPGDVVEVAAGTYGPQEMRAVAGRPRSPAIVFRPEGRAAVRLEGQTEIHASGLELRNIAMERWYVRPGARGVTLRHIRARAAFITSADDVRVLGGELGPVEDVDGLQVKAEDTVGAPVPTGLVIDGLHVHDVTRSADQHVECVQLGAGRDVVIRRSRFNRCGTQGVFVNSIGGTADVEGVLIENNWFGPAHLGYNSLIIASNPSNQTRRVVVRNNSFAQAPRFSDKIRPEDGVVVSGNAGVLSTCNAAVAYRHNVWSEVACGPTDLRASPSFRRPEAFDLRLRPGSPAVDHGDPDAYPPTDILGVRRPQGAGPDAGAHERE